MQQQADVDFGTSTCGNTSGKRSEQILQSGQIGIGIHDGFTGLLAQLHDFDFLWLSSFCLSAAAGVPDAGILGSDEVARSLAVVARVCDLPIVVDLDSGHGDPIRIRYVVNQIARAGAAAVCIEDNPTAKRCSLYEGYERQLASTDQHVARVHAARLGAGPNCAVIARTEALVARLGVDEALRRAHAYADAGADAIFVQCVRPPTDDLFEFGDKWARRTPLFLAPTAFPSVLPAEFFEHGATHVIYANHILRAAYVAIEAVLSAISRGATNDILALTSTVENISALVGVEDVVRVERLIYGGNDL